LALHAAVAAVGQARVSERGQRQRARPAAACAASAASGCGVGDAASGCMYSVGGTGDRKAPGSWDPGAV